VIERVKWRKREIEKNTQFMIERVKWRNREMDRLRDAQTERHELMDRREVKRGRER
jgi:hypothetical protein